MADQSLAKRVLGAMRRFAVRVAEVQVRVMLFVFYFTLLAPFALLMRWLDPLAIRNADRRGWSALDRTESDELERATHQS